MGRLGAVERCRAREYMYRHGASPSSVAFFITAEPSPFFCLLHLHKGCFCSVSTTFVCFTFVQSTGAPRRKMKFTTAALAAGLAGLAQAQTETVCQVIITSTEYQTATTTLSSLPSDYVPTSTKTVEVTSSVIVTVSLCTRSFSFPSLTTLGHRRSLAIHSQRRYVDIDRDRDSHVDGDRSAVLHARRQRDHYIGRPAVWLRQLHDLGRSDWHRQRIFLPLQHRRQQHSQPHRRWQQQHSLHIHNDPYALQLGPAVWRQQHDDWPGWDWNWSAIHLQRPNFEQRHGN